MGVSERIPRRALGALVWSGWVLAAAAACTELDPGTDRLESQIALNRPEAGVDDPRWACLDGPPVGAAAPVVPSVELTLAVVDSISGAPPAGLTARACEKIDVSCAMPVMDSALVATDGLLHLSVHQQFDGYVELTSPSSVPTMYFLNRGLMQDSSEALPTITSPALAALAAQGNVTLAPELGHLLIRAFDCLGEPASGVALSSSGGGAPFVFVDGLPNVGANVTSDAGLGGFVNVPVGLAVLEGRRVEGDRSLGQANVVVRPGWFTYGDVEPLPQ